MKLMCFQICLILSSSFWFSFTRKTVQATHFYVAGIVQSIVLSMLESGILLIPAAYSIFGNLKRVEQYHMAL